MGAIKRPDGSVCVPRGDATVREGDQVILFSLASVVPKLESAFLRRRGRGRAVP